MEVPCLPSADRAFIEGEKLGGYVLSPEHGRGQHKARVFSSALGIGREDWEYMRDQILERIPSAAVATVRVTSFGTLFDVPILLDGLNGATHEVTTAWIVAEDDDAPRLVSAYVNVP